MARLTSRRAFRTSGLGAILLTAPARCVEAQEIQLTGPLTSEPAPTRPTVLIGASSGIGVAWRSPLGAPFSESTAGVAPAFTLPSFELHWVPSHSGRRWRRTAPRLIFELGVSVPLANILAATVENDALAVGADVFFNVALDSVFSDRSWIFGPGVGFTLVADGAGASLALRLPVDVGFYFGRSSELGVHVRPWIETSLGAAPWGIGVGAVGLVEILREISTGEPSRPPKRAIRRPLDPPEAPTTDRKMERF